MVSAVTLRPSVWESHKIRALAGPETCRGGPKWPRIPRQVPARTGRSHDACPAWFTGRRSRRSVGHTPSMYLAERGTMCSMVMNADVLSQLRRGALEYCVLALLAR